MSDESKTVYTLQYPIEIEKEDGTVLTVEEIKLGRMKAKHLRLLPPSVVSEDGKTEMQPAEMLPIIAAMAGLSVEIIDELDIADLTPVMESISSFLGKDRSPASGKK